MTRLRNLLEYLAFAAFGRVEVGPGLCGSCGQCHLLYAWWGPIVACSTRCWLVLRRAEVSA